MDDRNNRNACRLESSESMSLLAFSIGGDSPGLESLAWGRGPLAMAGWAQDLYGHGEREMAWRALPAAFEWALAQAESAVFISAPYAESGLLAKARAWSEGPDAVLLGAKSWGDLGPSLDLLGLRRGGPALGQLKALLAQIQGSPRQRRLRQQPFPGPPGAGVPAIPQPGPQARGPAQAPCLLCRWPPDWRATPRTLSQPSPPAPSFWRGSLRLRRPSFPDPGQALRI